MGERGIMTRSTLESRFLLLVSLWVAVGWVTSTPPAAANRSVVEREVRAGDRLEVRNYKGKVRIVAWQRPEVRVEADLPSDEWIVFERIGSRWLVVPSSWARDSGDFALRLPDMARVKVVGLEPPPVDLVISMPAEMPLIVEAPHAGVQVEGARGAIDLTSMIGDLTVVGGGGAARLRSMTGRVRVEGTEGSLTVETATGPVEVRGSRGDLRVETSRGDVSLQDLSATVLEVTSLDGSIELRGPLLPGSRHDLSTHGGNVTLWISGKIDAQFSVRTFRGRFESPFEIDQPREEDRADFTLGDGSARVRLESFSGTVRIDR